jgi:lipase
MGFFGKPPGILPADMVTDWHERVPQLRPRLIPDVNHYTILFDRQAATTVAQVITTPAT